MKIAAIIARSLLGLAFALFGLNMIHPLSFMPHGVPPGDAGVFMGVMYAHGYLFYIGLVQLIGGLLTLSGRFTPLGLVFLGPILVNIILFHTLFGIPGILPGAVFCVIEIFLIWVYKANFNALFAPPIAK